MATCTPLAISSENTNPDQFLLFDAAELVTDPELETLKKQDEEQNKNNTSKRRSRKPFSSDLPHEKIFLYLTGGVCCYFDSSNFQNQQLHLPYH